jgi:phage gp29-like protein
MREGKSENDFLNVVVLPTLLGTYQLVVYANDVNMLGGSVHDIERNTEALVVASKEIGLEVNAEKTKYMVMSGDRNVGQQN